ncbi:MAG TPA: beta galactosidase jelly roll domain-containing protein, partial [Allosphingosinicella sp.]|nr:beta galactosidase jelly roll domain-containing protein [Allosphingosinicella sp.]
MKFLLAFLVALSAPAAAAPVLVAGDIRPATDLSGPWHWSVDPYRDGVAGFHGEEPGLGHRRYADLDVEAESAKNPNSLFEFDMARSPLAILPSSWITHSPQMRYYDGLVWYQRSFDAQPRPHRRYFLRFGAADYRADVFLNGKPLGAHEGGFTPFAFEATGLLRPGANQVTVGVDSQRSAATVPPTVTDWETYGGLTRPVRLIELPTTYVDDAWIRLAQDGHIRATVKLDGPAAAGTQVRVRIAGLAVTLSGRTGADGSWTGEAPAPAALKRWSPESPALYDVTVEAGEDRLVDRIGFRTIAVRGRDLLLNGKPIFLRGISLH